MESYRTTNRREGKGRGRAGGRKMLAIQWGDQFRASSCKPSYVGQVGLLHWQQQCHRPHVATVIGTVSSGREGARFVGARRRGGGAVTRRGGKGGEGRGGRALQWSFPRIFVGRFADWSSGRRRAAARVVGSFADWLERKPLLSARSRCPQVDDSHPAVLPRENTMD